MLAAARGGAFDVLLVGYISRFQRNLKQTLIAVEDYLHPAGVVILGCDERILSSDEDRWDEFVREAHEAESYSRQLARRVRQGLEARFDRHNDQWGRPPLGFRRTGGRPSLLEIDPETVTRAVVLFQRYAGGNVSQADLAAESGIAETAIKEMLRNPIYNGWMRRGRRSHLIQELEAPWRLNPPVSDALWEQVQTVRSSRERGGGMHAQDGRCTGRAAVLRLWPIRPLRRLHRERNPPAPSSRALRGVGREGSPRCAGMGGAHQQPACEHLARQRDHRPDHHGSRLADKAGQ